MKFSSVLFLLVTMTGHAQTVDCDSCVAVEKNSPLAPLKSVAQKLGCKSVDNALTLKPIVLTPTLNLSESVTWKAFGEEFDNFYGVKAYSNKSTGGGKYQCTELAHRFLNEVFGVPTTLGIGMGDGDVLAKNVTQRFKSTVIESNTGNKKSRLAYIENNCSSQAPVVGSVISIKFSSAPHVAVVREVKKIDDDNIEITLFEQHGIRRIPPGSPKQRTKMKMTRGSDGNWKGSQIVGWTVVTER